MFSNPFFLFTTAYWPLFFGACIALSLLFIKQQMPKMILAGAFTLMLLSAIVGRSANFMTMQGLLPWGYGHPIMHMIHLGATFLDLAGYGCILWALMMLRPDKNVVTASN